MGQTVTGSASPLPTIRNGANGPDGDRIEALTREWRPDVFVVGLPVRADGTDSAVTERVRAFAAELSEFGLPVEFVDERNTSGEAEAALKAARSRGSRGRLRKEDIDAAAAVLIAERWLASQAN